MTREIVFKLSLTALNCSAWPEMSILNLFKEKLIINKDKNLCLLAYFWFFLEQLAVPPHPKNILKYEKYVVLFSNKVISLVVHFRTWETLLDLAIKL